MKHILPVILVLGGHSLLAETVVQPADISATNAGNLYNGFGSSQLAPPNVMSSSFQPFNPALGTLSSFTVRYEIGGELSGGVGMDADMASANAGFGGTYKIGGSAFFGGGGGGGSEAEAGTELSGTYGMPAYERTFLPGDAGNPASGANAYDPAILTAVTGAAPVPVSFDMTPSNGVNVNYSNVEDLSASLNGKITLTYTYETGAGSEQLRVTGIVRNGAQETVSIEWTSSTGKTYAVEAWDGTGDWTTIAPSVTGGSYTEENVPATVRRRFYRVRENE